MNRDQTLLNRRGLLGTVGAGTVFALAGCVGSDDGDETGTDDDGIADDEEETTELSDPTAFPEDEACTVCNMITEEYPEWNSQLATTDETRVYFCSTGCLSAYVADPEQFDGEDEPIEYVWVTEYGTEELIDGMEASYVRVADPDHVDDVMMMNPTPFSERSVAESFVDELNADHDGEYDAEEDIITFEEFDYDLATHYRGDQLRNNE